MKWAEKSDGKKFLLKVSCGQKKCTFLCSAGTLGQILT
jgi:hypothetical protein